MMKKQILIIMTLVLTLMLCLSGCAKGTCHRCGDAITGDAVKAGGRSYCSYNCYWDEAIFGK